MEHAGVREKRDRETAAGSPQ